MICAQWWCKYLSSELLREGGFQKPLVPLGKRELSDFLNEVLASHCLPNGAVSWVHRSDVVWKYLVCHFHSMGHASNCAMHRSDIRHISIPHHVSLGKSRSDVVWKYVLCHFYAYVICKNAPLCESDTWDTTSVMDTTIVNFRTSRFNNDFCIFFHWIGCQKFIILVKCTCRNIKNLMELAKV